MPNPFNPQWLYAMMLSVMLVIALNVSVSRYILPSPRARITNAMHHDMARKIVPITPQIIKGVIIKNSDEYNISIISWLAAIKIAITGNIIHRAIDISCDTNVEVRI